LIRQLRGCDIVVVARPGAGEVGMAALREALEASAARAGLLDRTGRGTST
jgi:RNase P protein component